MAIGGPGRNRHSDLCLRKFFYLFFIRAFLSGLVGPEGIEPSTSVLSGQRSATELRARAHQAT